MRLLFVQVLVIGYYLLDYLPLVHGAAVRGIFLDRTGHRQVWTFAYWWTLSHWLGVFVVVLGILVYC